VPTRSSPQPSSEARADETDDDDDDEPENLYRVSRNRPGLLQTSVASVAPRVDEKVFFFTRVMTVL
jgi:hypothetical protein